MAMKIVPFAVFGLIVGMVAQVGVETMAGLGVYMVTVVLGLGAMLLVYTMIIRFVAKRPISSTFSRFRNPQTLAFSTASSMATMPVTLRTAEEDLKLDTRVSKFVIPLGTTVNMDGIPVQHYGSMKQSGKPTSAHRAIHARAGRPEGFQVAEIPRRNGSGSATGLAPRELPDSFRNPCGYAFSQ